MTAPGLRERNRRDITEALLEAGRRQLGEVGAAALSLRSVARDVGMVPSAVYRYFPSRDHLLTALLVEGYTGLADALEVAEGTVRPGDLAGRWRVVCHAARDWANGHPHEWSLLYGSPVPGYGAPDETSAQAVRIAGTFGRVLADLGPGERPPSGPRRLGAPLRQDLAALAASEAFTARGGAAAELPDLVLLRGIGAWVQVFGLISFERFGQFNTVVADLDGFFAAQVDIVWRTLAGL